MKKILIYSLGITLLFAGCEDKKKTSDTSEKDSIDVEITQDSSDGTKNSEKSISDKNTQIDKEKPRYPEITSENVKEFLTQYGKENPETKVLIETTFGNIEITLYEDTPLHRANFIYLVKQHYFDETVFHRVVPDFIIQAGNSDLYSTQKKRAELGKNYLLPPEIIPGRVHQYGTVSGAKEYRENPDHRTAPYEFFIFLGPISSTTHLNGKYTIFGRVTQGMDVVEKISEAEADSDDWPSQNIYIKTSVLE